SVKLFGTQATPPERRVVPPKMGAFSSRMTLSPRWVAVTAAEQAAAPLPTQMMSVSMAHWRCAAALAGELVRATPEARAAAVTVVPASSLRRPRSILSSLLFMLILLL